MNRPNLYIISGCNGAGKTTASFTVLPEMLKCDEFINADEIAKGLSPLNPDKSSIEAGRLMLNKIKKLIVQKRDFAFETTLSTKSFVNTIKEARKYNYKITLLFFWLESIELAKQRVKIRVSEGGHNIPSDIIERRYIAGIRNLFKLYLSISDNWMILDNSNSKTSLIAEGEFENTTVINHKKKFDNIRNYR